MTQIVETIPAHLSDPAEAARALFSANEGVAFKLTGIVDPERASEPIADGSPSSELQLILCGERDGQDVCLRERFRVSPAGDGFDVSLVADETPEVGSAAPELDPPVGVRAGWLDEVLPKHAFTVLVFYRGFW